MAAKKPPTRKPPKPRAGPKLDLLPKTQVDEYLWPWALSLVAVPAGGLMLHQVAVQGWASPWALTAYSLAAGGVLAVCGWHYSKGRRELLRWHAVATMLLGGAAAAVSVWLGVHPRWLLWQFLLGIVNAGSWNLRRAEVIRGDGRDQHLGEDGWGEVLGLPNSRLFPKQAKRVNATVEIPGRVAEGLTVKDAQGLVPSLEARADARPGSWRILPGATSAAFRLLITDRDVLKRSPKWPGLQPGPRSIVEGVPFAVFEDGDAVVWAPVDKTGRPVGHLQVMGMTNSGKSHLAKLIAAVLHCTDDVVIWWSDSIKGRQTLGPIRDAVDWYAGSIPETSDMFDSLDRVIRARADWLGDRHIDPWRVGCGIPLLVVWIEEAARTVQSDRFTRLVEAGRSTGVVIANSMQRASHDNIPTSARASIADAICLGVREELDAGFVLSDEVIAAGAAPWMWKGTKEGSLYAQLSQYDLEHQSMPARSYSYAAKVLTEAIGSRPRDALDAVSQVAAGEAYAKRKEAGGHEPVAGVLEETQVSEQNGTGPGPSMVDLDAELGVDIDADADEELRVHDVGAAVGDDGGMAEEMALVDPRADLEEHEPGTRHLTDPFTPAPDGRELSPGARHEAFARCMREVARGNQREGDGAVLFELDQPYDLWLATPGLSARQRPAFTRRLLTLRERGLVERTARGAYRMAPGFVEQLLSEGLVSVPATQSDE